MNRLSRHALMTGFLLPIISATTHAGTWTEVQFTPTPFPTNLTDQTTTHTHSSVILTDRQGQTRQFPLKYHRLFGVQDKIGLYEAGRLFDRKMNPLTDPFGQPTIAETPDANSLLAVEGQLHLITHYEYDWLLSDGSVNKHREPMSMTHTRIQQDAATGLLTAVDQTPISFKSVHGIWIPCFGSQTPWNTHLGSEEDYDLQYSPDNASTYRTTLSGLHAMKKRYDIKHPNPYHYGFLTEIRIDPETQHAKPTKHYGVGRGTWEMGKVMPDRKTVYFGDDGVNSGMFMFVADVAGDLSKGGKLYAARWHQQSPTGSDGGKAHLSWVYLGKSKNDHQIERLADEVTFDDLFVHAEFDQATRSCPKDMQWIRAGSEVDECLAIQPDMETAAAFLETRRTAALKGASIEFTKLEGITFDPERKQLYMSMSRIEKGMTANPQAPTDHIQLKENKAGATYTASTVEYPKDTQGNRIDSPFVADQIWVEPELLGVPIAIDTWGNTADPDRIANTDNLVFSPALRTLFIGEDSAMHVHNFLWAYQVDQRRLTRILSTPIGAELTGLQMVEQLNGHAYIMSNTQHHGDWAMGNERTKEALSHINRFDAAVGYIGGLPRLSE